MASHGSSSWFRKEKKKAKHSSTTRPAEIVMTKVTHTGAESGPVEISSTGIVSAVAMAIACLSADASAQEHGLRKLVNLARNVCSAEESAAHSALSSADDPLSLAPGAPSPASPLAPTSPLPPGVSSPPGSPAIPPASNPSCPSSTSSSSSSNSSSTATSTSSSSSSSPSLLAEAIPLVVPLLGSSFPVIQMFATFALVYLAQDRANQAAIRDLGAVPLLVPLLASHNAEIVEKVIWLFTILSQDRASRLLLQQEGAVPLLCAMLSNPSRWEQLMGGVLTLLRNLFFEVEHQDAFAQCGGVQTLMNLPVLTSQLPSVQLHWVILVAILSFFRPNIRTLILDSGAVPTLVTLLSTSESGPIRSYATQALTNLSFDVENVEGIMNSGAGRPLINLFRLATSQQVPQQAVKAGPASSNNATTSSSSVVVDALLFEHVLAALTNLAMTDDDIIAILLEEEVSVQQLLDVCAAKSPFGPFVMVRATQFLATVARFERARRVLLELGALPAFQAPIDPPGSCVDLSAVVAAAQQETLDFITGHGDPNATTTSSSNSSNSSSSNSSTSTTNASSNSSSSSSSNPSSSPPSSSGGIVPASCAANPSSDISQGLVLHAQLLAARSMAIHNLNIPFSAEFKKTLTSAERPDPKPSTQRDPHEQHRMRVINEILETEKNYVANLLVVCKVYEEPLADLPPKTKGMVSVDERRAMFKMFDYLYHAHQDFLQSLQKSVFEHHKDPNKKLGPVFLELASCLKSYRVFMNNYEIASNTLAAALKRPAFAAWAEGQEEKFKTKSLPNLLIEPIQRIPRYLLLLHEILRKMDASHIDYADFTHALEQIEEAANFLEAEKDKAVHKSKLIELQGQIKGLTAKNIDLTAFSWRRFIHSGQLLLESGKSKMSEYVHFFLISDLLIVGSMKKSEIHVQQVFNVKNIIVSNVQNEVDEGDERNAFQILADKVNLIVSTTKASEKADWLSAFKKAITEIKSLPV